MPIDYNAEARIAYLKWLDSEDAAESALVRLVREYASGKQPTYLTDRQREFIGLKARDRVHLYSHNLCQLVIEALVERLSIEEFEPVDENETDTSYTDWLELLNRLNQLNALQDTVHEAAVRDGSAYLIVDWDSDKQRPRWTLNYAYDGSNGIKTAIDPNSAAPLFAIKTWQVNDPFDRQYNNRTRKTLYFPDRVEKYINSQNSNNAIGGTRWEAFQDDPGEPWPIPWVDNLGKPLGIAAVEFLNPGGSEIEQLLPMQDMLNKCDLDLVAAQDSSGFRILYAIGVTTRIDKATGEAESLHLSPGKLVTLPDVDSKLGSIEPTDPQLLIATCNYWIQSIAGVSRTPQYLFQAMGADQPSGESLKQQEIGLIHKADRRQRVFGNAWETVMELSARLHNLYIPSDPLTPTLVETKWQSADQFADELAHEEREAAIRKTNAEAALLEQQLGVSQMTILTGMGLDPAEEMAQAGQDNASMGETMLRAFDTDQQAQ